jgi:hypothetical protein
VYGG